MTAADTFKMTDTSSLYVVLHNIIYSTVKTENKMYTNL